jgi:hypothetical protein
MAREPAVLSVAVGSNALSHCHHGAATGRAAIARDRARREPRQFPLEAVTPEHPDQKGRLLFGVNRARNETPWSRPGAVGSSAKIIDKTQSGHFDSHMEYSLGHEPRATLWSGTEHRPPRNYSGSLDPAPVPLCRDDRSTTHSRIIQKIALLNIVQMILADQVSFLCEPRCHGHHRPHPAADYFPQPQS